MSDYICFLTSVTVILRHIKIATTQWKKEWCGWKFVMICHKVFTSKIKVFHKFFVDFTFSQCPPWKCYNFPGMADIECKVLFLNISDKTFCINTPWIKLVHSKDQHNDQCVVYCSKVNIFKSLPLGLNFVNLTADWRYILFDYRL